MFHGGLRPISSGKLVPILGFDAARRIRCPENAVAIAGKGAGDQLVLLKQNGVFAPEVYAWIHESGELKK